MMAAELASTSSAPLRMRFGRRIPFVHLVHGKAKAPVQLMCKPARAPRIVVFGTIGVERHTHHQRSRLPLVG